MSYNFTGKVAVLIRSVTRKQKGVDSGAYLISPVPSGIPDTLATEIQEKSPLIS